MRCIQSSKAPSSESRACRRTGTMALSPSPSMGGKVISSLAVSSSSRSASGTTAPTASRARGGGEEAEGDGGAGDQPEILAGQHLLRPFFHAQRDHAYGLDRRAIAGDGGHGGIEPDIIAARGARADAHALAPELGEAIGG